ncbi:MAG: GTPase HflX [Deinococcus sp.]|nr:GTPase HflX [Deinococcus sp.]
MPLIDRVLGKVNGLKASQLQALARLYRRKVPPDLVYTNELARTMGELSADIGREVAVLLDRAGRVRLVSVGDAGAVPLPPLERSREGRGRLRGLRCLHTHPRGGGLSRGDLSALVLSKLDLMVALELRSDGLPTTAHLAYLAPPTAQEEDWILLEPQPALSMDLDFAQLVQSVEEELARAQSAVEVDRRQERALLVGVWTPGDAEVEERLAELKELARTAGAQVLQSVIQRRTGLDPRYVVGQGKLSELVLRANHLDADLLIFDRELTPAQTRSLGEGTNLKVIDRTQLILDIFAQRAKSPEAKAQVELAQLRYRLPRLIGQGEALSRLGGGIGTRGPGETKLEIDRRRVRERIGRLEREMIQLGAQRSLRRRARGRSGLPVVAIVGYTNAGKSTLFNALTGAEVLADDLLFATLRPTTRRYRTPAGRDILLTDTVGFIRQLPLELLRAFRATLEELAEASLLLHLVDASHPEVIPQVEEVERVVRELGLDQLPRLVVLNKQDVAPPEVLSGLVARYDALAISALHRQGLGELGRLLERRLGAH